MSMETILGDPVPLAEAAVHVQQDSHCPFERWVVAWSKNLFGDVRGNLPVDLQDGDLIAVRGALTQDVELRYRGARVWLRRDLCLCEGASVELVRHCTHRWVHRYWVGVGDCDCERYGEPCHCRPGVWVDSECPECHTTSSGEVGVTCPECGVGMTYVARGGDANVEAGHWECEECGHVRPFSAWEEE